MALQIVVMRFFVLLQRAQNAIFENQFARVVFASEGGAESHMQNLSRIVGIEETEKAFRRAVFRGRNLLEFCRDVIRCFVRVVPAAAEIENLAEQLRLFRGDGSQRFEITRARGFDVNMPELQRADRLIDAEFVAARMDSDLYGPGASAILTCLTYSFLNKARSPSKSMLF